MAGKPINTLTKDEMYDMCYIMYGNFTYMWVKHKFPSGQAITQKDIQEIKRKRHPIRCWLEDNLSIGQVL